jgi:sulfonate transport system substrate-binding protein
MPHPSNLRRQLLLASLAGFGLSATAGLQAQTQALPAGPAQLRIGFQKSSVNLVLLKQRGQLEKAFPGTRVQWVEFPAGPQILEALSVGSLDVGFTGDAPPVFAQSAGKSLLYIGAELPKPQSSAILVPANSPLKTLADLKGRRVAFQRGSSAHFLVVRALAKAGVAWSDIQPLYLTPSEARAAFERGSVDAWGIWDPFYAAAEVDVKPRVLSNGVGLSDNNSFYLGHPDWVKAHPKAVVSLLRQLTETDQWLQAHRTDAARLLAEFSGLGLATVLRFIERRPATPTRPLWDEVIREQQRVADAFFQQGLIPRAVKVQDVVWAV